MTDQETQPRIQVLIGSVARGNPGLAGAGIILKNELGVIVLRSAKYLGSATGLDAELKALDLGIRYAKPYAPKGLDVSLTNDTARRQLLGMAARHPSIVSAIDSLEELLAPFSTVTYRIGAEHDMSDAIELANTGINTRLGPLPFLNLPLP